MYKLSDITHKVTILFRIVDKLTRHDAPYILYQANVDLVLQIEVDLGHKVKR